MKNAVRIGTRESQLAVWQASLVQQQLAQHGISGELVFIKSEGDIDLITPLYEMGVQGVFTKTLDTALLSDRIDVAVHSMKDVPTQLAKGIVQAAVLERGSHKDLLVYKDRNSLQALGFVNGEWAMVNETLSSSDHSKFKIQNSKFNVATSSVRRKAQWLNRYPHHQVDNLRGNVNTRLQKLDNSNWNGAIFAAAGLERISLKPANAVELDWMLPAPSQGAIMVVCRDSDATTKASCVLLNHAVTALCTKIEKDFLRVLMGGCTTPISALAILRDDTIFFQGNILSLDGKDKVEIEQTVSTNQAESLGTWAAQQLLEKGGDKIVAAIRNAGT